MGRKKKPLLAEQGIVHLKHSFVQPTEESGLLKTVGGEVDRTALILATGTYGYAIPMSTLTGEGTEGSGEGKGDETPVEIEVVDEEDASDAEGEGDKGEVVNVIKESGGKGSKRKGGGESGGKEKKKKEINPDELSVAELVRIVGGGGGAPLRRCDVVDDRKKAEGEGEKEETEEKEDDPEADAFYESLGIERSKRRKLDNDENPESTAAAPPPEANGGEGEETSGDGVLQSIADYYQDNAQHVFYYSAQHTPFDNTRLQFGHFIDASEDASTDATDYIQMAKLAQRARAAAAAAALRRMQEERKKAGEGGEVEKKEEEIYDPLPMEVVASTKPEELGITVDTNLEQYWTFVKEDPHDFDRWIYLIQYVENIDNLPACRGVYSAFLPLFPYCFGYWKRYAELEKKSYYFGRALAILDKGLEFIPLSVDLWLCYLALYQEINAHQPNFEELVRKEYERALNTCGMEFRSDPLWEAYIEWETQGKRVRRAFTLFKRLIQVPTRLYNRHWDNIQVVVRDHHPRIFLQWEEYESLRKKGCKKLGLRYKPEPEVEPGEIRKTSKPEDKLMDYTKTRVLEQLTKLHAKCETAVNARWTFEDKIKRPYFHTKPLDKFQLRNWEEYLNFEIGDENHERIVLLFERCLIACAHYEQFWCKYARYMESYHKIHSKDQNISALVQKSKLNEAELISKKETEREEALIKDVKDCLDDLMANLVEDEEREREAKQVLDSVIDQVIFLQEDKNFVFNPFSTVKGGGDYLGGKGDAAPDLGGNQSCEGGGALPPKSGNEIDQCVGNSEAEAEVTSLLSVPQFPEAMYRWQETVRDIYRRACIIHCPRKPLIRLQWAAYEEELGNVEESRQLIQHVLHWFPAFMDGKLQLLDLERRAENHAALEELYDKYLAVAKTPAEYSLLASKYARWMFKERGKADKALTILRKAIRKDKANPSLYSQVFQICYERYPSDRKGAAASLELAILSKDLSDTDKLQFQRRKMLFLQEHGDIRRVRDAVEQLRVAEEKAHQLKLEEARKKEEEQKEIAFLRSEALRKLESFQNNPIASAELQAYPVPDKDVPTQKPVPIEFEDESQQQPPSQNNNNGPIRAQIITQGSSVSEVLKEGPELPYVKVPPPQGLQNVVDSATYGYGSKHPDQKIMEHMAQKEYEKLEAKGYPEHQKDTEDDLKYLRAQSKIKHSGKDPTFCVQPTSNYSVVPVGPPPRRRQDPPAPGELELQPPRAMAVLPVPSTAPCVNVPDWFIKEGGELCISETRLGFSTVRYWPHFLTELGNEKMYRSIRRHVKWHQKQKIIAGHWRYLHRLVSWLGPCDFTHNGMVLGKCEDWPPEILDQLHRINKMVNHEFNACSLDLYRHGHDWYSWHSDNLPAYGSNPPVAIVSLGNIRILELKRKGPEFNYLRFPLFPGSLFLMEGVTQADWAHQITKDPLIKDETLMLTFRIMHAIEIPEVIVVPRKVRDERGSPSKGTSKESPRKEGKGESSSRESKEKTGSKEKASSGGGGEKAEGTKEKSQDAPDPNPKKSSEDPASEKNNTRIIFHKVR